MARGGRKTFRNDLEVAEIATMAVRANLEFGEAHVAAALQPVARAAWELVDGRGEVAVLRREIRAAETRLRLACFAHGERRFLRDLRRYIDARGPRRAAGTRVRGHDVRCVVQEWVTLEHGLPRAVPEEAEAAWGARLIFPDDLLYNRQGFWRWETPAGERLKEWLNVDRALRRALESAKQMDDIGALRPTESRQVVLYEDAKGVIVGNPKASRGYLYIAAWLKVVT